MTILLFANTFYVYRRERRGENEGIRIYIVEKRMEIIQTMSDVFKV
jgi:hypothetical protein